MYLYTVNQIQSWDQFTIQNEPISSIMLMERAAISFTKWLLNNYSSKNPVVIFAGNGNNGGDALAVGRLLRNLRFDVTIYSIQLNNNLTEDCLTNLKKLHGKYQKITSEKDFQSIVPCTDNTLVIDGIFGSGLTRPVEGSFQSILKKINLLNGIKISIDIPSGLYCDVINNEGDTIFEADQVISFQIPKRSFLFPENKRYVKSFELVDIGLAKNYNETSNWKFIESKDINIPSRNKFSHKGTFGHALIIAGSKGKMGAAILSSKAALKSGCGLVTCHLPQSGNDIFQTSFPEAMTTQSKGKDIISDLPNLNNFKSIGIGPGLGTDTETKQMLYKLLKSCVVPMVIDADALNIISEENWIKDIPENSIITPHPKEFERLFGKTMNSLETFELQMKMSKKFKIYIIKKGAYTSISTPEGDLFFNSTGTPGMATAGSGDVLTGIITSLLAQGLSHKQAAISGVFIHGQAGDAAAKKIGVQSMIASDLIINL